MISGYRPTYSFSALVWLAIVLLVVGGLMGAAYAGTELLNPKTSEARANEMNRATEYQIQRDELELEYREQMLQAEAAAQEEQLRLDAEFQEQQRELELARQRERAALDLKLASIGTRVLWGVGSLVAVTMAGGLTYYLISLGQKQRNTKLYLEQLSELRKSVRARDQVNEQLLRRLEDSQQQIAALYQQMASFQQQMGKVFVISGNGGQRDPMRIEQ